MQVQIPFNFTFVLYRDITVSFLEEHCRKVTDCILAASQCSDNCQLDSAVSYEKKLSVNYMYGTKKIGMQIEAILHIMLKFQVGCASFCTDKKWTQVSVGKWNKKKEERKKKEEIIENRK